MPRHNFARQAAARRFAHKGMCLFGTRASLKDELHKSPYNYILIKLVKLERGGHNSS